MTFYSAWGVLQIQWILSVCEMCNFSFPEKKMSFRYICQVIIVRFILIYDCRSNGSIS